jgi:hypothetical protein
MTGLTVFIHAIFMCRPTKKKKKKKKKNLCFVEISNAQICIDQLNFYSKTNNEYPGYNGYCCPIHSILVLK